MVLICTFVISFFSQWLLALSKQTVQLDARVADINTICKENQDKLTTLTDEYTNEYLRRAYNFAYILKQDPSLIDDDKIEELADRAQVQGIFIFNDKGQAIATNTVYKDFRLSKDKKEQSYEFWNIIKGYKESVAQKAQRDNTAEHSYLQYVGVKRLDAPGIVQLSISPQTLAERTKTAQINYTLENTAVENHGFLLAINKSDKTISYYPNEKTIGIAASKLGITESLYRDGYTGYQQINDTKCFVSCLEYKDSYIVAAMPVSSITHGRLGITLLTTGIIMLVLMILFFFSIINSKKNLLLISEELAKKEEEPDQTNRITSPEQKLQRITASIIGLLCIILILYINFGESTNPII